MPAPTERPVDCQCGSILCGICNPDEVAMRPPIPPPPPSHPCRACGLPSGVGMRHHRDMALCDPCRDHYAVCHRCRAVRTLDDMSEDTNGDRTDMCLNCDNVGIIQPYSAKPTLVPLGNWPHVGVECEVECDDDYVATARRVLRTLPRDFVITKEDGSLSDYGFEICSRPASLDEHRRAWEPLFVAKSNGLLGTMISYGNDRCGLHVHVSRQNLSQHSIALIVCAINLPRWRRFVEVIANRTANRYTQFKAKRMSNAMYGHDKYEAVNLMHRETVEFRIFKGTLRRSSFFKALEFCESITLWMHSTYNTRIALSLPSYIRFVSGQPERWRYLNAYIANRWFGKHSPLFSHDLWTLKNNAKPPPPPVEFNNDGRAA